MKDEIKEIKRILATSGKYITYAEKCYVLDCITNLQDKIKKYEYFSLGDKYIIENADILDKPVDFMINKIKCFLEELVKNKKIKDESSREIIVTMLTLNEDRIHWLNTCFLVEEENKKLKHRLEQMYNDTKDTYNEICAEQIDYKSRIDKAIEYIKEHTLYSFDLYDKDDVSSYFEKASPKDLLNILQGDDESENKSNK